MLESRGNLDAFTGGEGARALPDAELPARQPADANLGGRAEVWGIVQPSHWGEQRLGTRVGFRRDARTGAACRNDSDEDEYAVVAWPMSLPKCCQIGSSMREGDGVRLRREYLTENPPFE